MNRYTNDESWDLLKLCRCRFKSWTTSCRPWSRLCNDYNMGWMEAPSWQLVGQMPPCYLGKNKIKHFTKWKDWISEAEKKKAFLSMGSGEYKIDVMRSCREPELIEFWGNKVHWHYSRTWLRHCSTGGTQLRGNYVWDLKDDAQYCQQRQSHHRPAAYWAGRCYNVESWKHLFMNGRMESIVF